MFYVQSSCSDMVCHCVVKRAALHMDEVEPSLHVCRNAICEGGQLLAYIFLERKPPFRSGSAPMNFQQIWGRTTWSELTTTTKFVEALKKGTAVMALE